MIFEVQFDFNDGTYDTLATFSFREDAEKYLTYKQCEYMRRHLKVNYRIIKVTDRFGINNEGCKYEVIREGGVIA